MLGNYVFDFIIWLVQHLLLPLFPESLPVLSYGSYLSKLNTIEPVISNFLSPLNAIFDVNFLLTLIVSIFFLEFLAFSIRSLMWLINLFRGSGA